MNATVARIEAGPRLARVSPPFEALLAPRLSCAARRFDVGGPRGHRRKQGQLRFYRVEDGALYFPSAAVAEVEAVLRRAGLDVQVVQQPQQGADLGADHQFVEQLPPGDRELLEAVLRHPVGIVEVGKPSDKEHAVGLVCRLWPAARVLIAVPARRQMRTLYNQLQPHLGDQLQTPDGWRFGTKHRVLIGTHHVYDNCIRDDWDVVLFPEPLAAVARGHRAGQREFRERRCYGFMPRGVALDKRMALTIGWCIGPVIYRAPDPLGHAAGVRVCWVTPPWWPAVRCADALERKRATIWHNGGRADALERKRATIWHNGGRNDFVAAVARAAGAANAIELDRLGVNGAAVKALQVEQQTPLRITILVESTEHGRELLRRLPGWELWSMAPADRNARKQRAMNDIFTRSIDWSLDKRIVTFSLASKLASLAAELPWATVPQDLDTDVLIRADGGSGTLNLPGFPPRSPETGRQVLLIDIADDFDADAVDACRQRYREYARRGWTIAAAPRWLLDEEAVVPGHGVEQQHDRHRGHQARGS
jgi:hypothetical protein